ncbi:hypothetical protein ACHQM5_004595 [Ranunculus cassubicifolius]
MDDIHEYIDARYIAPPETVWQLLQFHERAPRKRPMTAIELEKDRLTKDGYGLHLLKPGVPRPDYVIKLPPQRKLPHKIQQLFDGDDTRNISLQNHSREYNQGRQPMYSQLYVYDPDDQGSV